MARKYGIPYKGSKSKIAEELLGALPEGRRLVDLFGGGFAISQCALMKYAAKWPRVLYNDKDGPTVQLVKDVLAGRYNEDVFHPEWISRDEFYKRRDTDGYVKWVWSFGNNGQDYLFGRGVEEMKRQVFEFIVNGTPGPYTEGITLTTPVGHTHERRLEWMRESKKKTNAAARCGAVQSDAVRGPSTHRGGLHRVEALERTGDLGTKLLSLCGRCL